MAENLTPYEAFNFLKKNKIDVCEFKLAMDRKSAVKAAADIGFPVVLKTNSKKVIHKSDAGCVRLGLGNKKQVEAAYDEIVKNVKKVDKKGDGDGIVVFKMLPKGVEVIIGVVKDPQFGHMIMFGLGGIFVELLKDVSFRKVPVTPDDASEMIEEIKGRGVLKGFRGIPGSDEKALRKLIVQVSEVVNKNKKIKELDLNPVIVYPSGCTPVDGRIIITDA